MSNRPPDTPLNLPHLKLSTKGQGDAYETFGWQFAFNELTATHYNGQRGGDAKYFNMRVNPSQLVMFTGELLKAAKTEGPYRGAIFTLESIKKKEHLGTLAVGKDDEGIIWVSITGEGVTKRKYYLTLPQGTRLADISGKEYTRAEISVMRARSYAQLLFKTAIDVYGDNFDAAARAASFDKGGGGGKGGGGRNSNSDDSSLEGDASGGW